MKKIVTISFLALIILTSCNKQVSEMLPENMSGTNINTPVGSIEMTQSGINVAAGENSIGVGEDGVNITAGEEKVGLNSSGMELNSKEGNIKMDENGMTSDIPGMGSMSITNKGTQIGDINISSGNVAEEFTSKAISDELNNLEMNLDSAANLNQTMGNGSMSQE